MVAELYGRVGGCCKGRGGSVHLNDPSVGLIASSAILGETMATAVGSAWSFAMDGQKKVAVTFFGDGTAEEGIFHEVLNFAVVKNVPVIFACENNGYSTHTPLDVRQPRGIAIWERANKAYGMPSRIVDGNDVFACYDAAVEAVQRARRGEGPSFIEFTTYRWREHVGPNWDYDAGYRTKDEVDAWIARDPIERAARRLLADGACTDEDIAGWKRDARAEVDEAVARAKASPFPPVDELLVGTY
jgi:pyruvate dehydrogenase E1 component alpha subunit